MGADQNRRYFVPLLCLWGCIWSGVLVGTNLAQDSQAVEEGQEVPEVETEFYEYNFFSNADGSPIFGKFRKFDEDRVWVIPNFGAPYVQSFWDLEQSDQIHLLEITKGLPNRLQDLRPIDNYRKWKLRSGEEVAGRFYELKPGGVVSLLYVRYAAANFKELQFLELLKADRDHIRSLVANTEAAALLPDPSQELADPVVKQPKKQTDYDPLKVAQSRWEEQQKAQREAEAKAAAEQIGFTCSRCNRAFTGKANTRTCPYCGVTFTHEVDAHGNERALEMLQGDRSLLILVGLLILVFGGTAVVAWLKYQ